MPRAATYFLTFVFTIPYLAHAVGQEATSSDTQEVDTAGHLETTKEPDVIYVPTPQHVVDVMLGLAGTKKEDVVYDLGCGDGRIVVTAAKRYGCRALGVDIDPVYVRLAEQNVKEADVEDLVEIKQQDIFEMDLSQADVIAMFLTRELNVRLIPQLDKMKPGSRIVSHSWEMKGVKPKTVVNIEDDEFGPSRVFLWEVPLNKLPLEDESPIVESPPSFFARVLDSVWNYTTRRTYQRIIILLLIPALAIAAFIGLSRQRKSVNSSA